MITESELQTIIDLMYELCTLADPSEYTQKEVDDAIAILESLKKYDTELILKVIKLVEEIKSD